MSPGEVMQTLAVSVRAGVVETPVKTMQYVPGVPVIPATTMVDVVVAEPPAVSVTEPGLTEQAMPLPLGPAQESATGAAKEPTEVTVMTSWIALKLARV